jgi:hypothetical protein
MSKVPNHIGRRALLRGTALTTVATTLPALPAFAARAPAPNCADNERQLVDHFRDLIAAGRADDALVDAEAEITRLFEWLSANPDADEKLERDPVYDQIYALDDFIAATPPKTLAGVAVKLRRVLDAEVGMAPNGINDVPALLSILDFVHRTIGEPAHATRPVYITNPFEEELELLAGGAA